MNRALRFTLLGLAVIAVLGAGCADTEGTGTSSGGIFGLDRKSPLEAWASTVCFAYDGYATPEVKSGLKKLDSLYWAAYGVSGPDDVDLKNFPELREDAPTLISQDLLLAEIAHVDAAHRA